MPGNMPTPGAGQSDATAGAGAIPADTSMMPSSGGSYLAYLHGPGLLAPTDALVARASHAVAVCNAGDVIRSDIPIFDFNFTTDGGMPMIGAPVYIAASNDTNTYAIVNGGTTGGTIFTFGASPTAIQGLTVFFNSVDWVLVGIEYLAA